MLSAIKGFLGFSANAGVSSDEHEESHGDHSFNMDSMCVQPGTNALSLGCRPILCL